MASRVLLLLAAFYVRRLLIQYIGNEANGIEALFGSIIGLLSVAELGVGSAIIFSMYKPIVDDDKKSVAALYCLYRRLYRIIGAVIFIAGQGLMPLLPVLISDYEALDINVFVTFTLTLISVTISYLYSAKTSLIEAYKDGYINTAIVTASRLLRYLMQIAAILIWKSFSAYIVCQIIETMIIWIVTEHIVRKLHPDIIAMNEKLDKEATAEVTKNVKAMFMHKIGAILVGAVDSIIISAFIGVTILGKYTNYTAICGAMTGILALLFTPLTAVVGHLCASGKSEEIKGYFAHFYSVNYIIGLIFFLGYYAVADNTVELLFGSGLVLPVAIPFVITLNSFIGYMRYSPLLFRDASGTFYYDRWKPLAEGLANLMLSLLFVKTFPAGYEVVGVIVATIVTNLLICDIVEPHIIFKYVFKESEKSFCIRNYINIGVFITCMAIMSLLRVDCSSSMAGIMVNGSISIGISLAALLIISIADREFRNECCTMLNLTMKWLANVTSR